MLALVGEEDMVRESTVIDLKAALRDLEEKKRRIEEQISAAAIMIQYFEGMDSNPIPQPEQPSAARSPSPSNVMRDAMNDVLAAHGPLHRTEVHRRIVEMGIVVGGRDPVRNVGTYLSLDQRFKSVGSGMWDVAERIDETNQPERQSAAGDPPDDEYQDHEEENVP